MQIGNKSQVNRKQTASKSQVKTNNNDNNDNNVNKEQEFINLVKSETELLMVRSDIIDDFCNYWTERNIGGTKMRYEMQKTFDIKRRMQRWINNQKEWKPITKHKNEEFKLDATGYNRIAYCSKCNVSDFYKYPATEDSRCCGDKLKPTNK